MVTKQQRLQEWKDALRDKWISEAVTAGFTQTQAEFLYQYGKVKRPNLPLETDLSKPQPLN
jgi:hypothetical protein